MMYKILAIVYFHSGKICENVTTGATWDKINPNYLKEYFKRYYFDKIEDLKTVNYTVQDEKNIIIGRNTIRF